MAKASKATREAWVAFKRAETMVKEARGVLHKAEALDAGAWDAYQRAVAEDKKAEALARQDRR